jgi:hypothetical protein
MTAGSVVAGYQQLLSQHVHIQFKEDFNVSTRRLLVLTSVAAYDIDWLT